MAEPTLFDPETPTGPPPAPRSRIAFTGDGRHWHGTVSRHSTRPDGSPRLHIDVDPGNDGINSVVYRLGGHFRPTRQGETCPDCGKPDPGLPMYSRP